uniref:Ig-like domain-containing protein n=1 Tax=Calidris pygmaea TaxID=425635 RepID=A0A8C3KIC8_9CHAR
GPGELGVEPGAVLLAWGLAGRPHSLRYFYTAVSEPSPGVPWFLIEGYVDGNLILRYDSETGRMVPRADWMVANLDQQYWDTQTQIAQRNQQVDHVNLEILRGRYNQSGGLHVRQRMSGCDLLEDGSTRGYYQSAYDGRDFIALDMDTMTFTAVDAAAQITKRKWEEDGTVAEEKKNYLKNTCIESLRKYMSYGRAVLERKERPTVRVSGKEGDGFLTLHCRAYGFYPRPISVSWLKDGEVRDQETERGGPVPNSDGTYYTWASIKANPGEKDKYRCRVEHASLPEAEVYAWGEPGGLGHGEGRAGVVPLPLLMVVLLSRDGVQPGGHRGGGGCCRPGCRCHLWIHRMEAEVR